MSYYFELFLSYLRAHLEPLGGRRTHGKAWVSVEFELPFEVPFEPLFEPPFHLPSSSLRAPRGARHPRKGVGSSGVRAPFRAASELPRDDPRAPGVVSLESMGSDGPRGAPAGAPSARRGGQPPPALQWVPRPPFSRCSLGPPASVEKRIPSVGGGTPGTAPPIRGDASLFRGLASLC